MPGTVLRVGYMMEKKTNTTLPSREHSPVEETGTKPASGPGGKPFPEDVVLLGNLEKEIRLNQVEK